MKHSFCWQERGRSFSYAWAGLKTLVRTEHNARIHAALTAAVLLMAVWLGVNRTEATALLLVTAFVWVAEIFNTAIEKAMDFISTQKHPQIKMVKDLAAAAVLLSAVTAFLTGALIFLPKLFTHA